MFIGIFFFDFEKMIIEMFRASEYSLLTNLDSLVAIVMQDIAFYKDSLNTAGSVRIDYAFTPDPGMRKIRFKKYEPDGDLYLSNRNRLSRMKVDQDTLTILVQKTENANSHLHQDEDKIFSAKVTFCLNNYTNADKLLSDNGRLNHVIDTLANTAKKKHRSLIPSYSTIKYHPTDTTGYPAFRFRKVNYLLEDDRSTWNASGMIMINGSIGAGLVRNTFAPMAELGIELNERLHINPKKFSFMRLSAMPYFFFDKDLKNNIQVYDNWFANVELGTQLKDKRNSIGVGYLFAGNGGYFQNTTMKAFISFPIGKQFTLCPEIIFTNNFKQIFPGVTLRF